MSGRADCRKFAPNIFNKSKCTNCFRQKEEHSAEALESNRASRKVSKCGYLFVAPGWDFSNPLYRTKRWQRRWFVLYDDGELTYSLDEHPDTVPQASIDMTGVLEVSAADGVTGHAHSLAIAAPERVTFVRATCREEARWWADVLQVFPRSKGRHKRNATFPGGQPASLLQTSTTVRNGCGGGARPRYNSCHAGAGWATRPQPPQPEIPTLAPPAPAPAIPPPDTKVYTDQPVSSASPPTRDKINGEEKARSRRRDAWTEPPPPAPPVDEGAVNGAHRSPLLQPYDEQLRDIAASLTRPRCRRALAPPHLEPPTRDPPDHLDKFIAARGSPDGGSPPESGAGEPRVELPAERLLHARAGWLQRRSAATWSRHWFVLRGAALLYFRDPQAEHRGLMDGVIDLSGISRVEEVASTGAGYAFETETWDNRVYVLSAVTAGIRSNWISAIRRTAGLPELPASCRREDTFPTGKELPLLAREDSVEMTEATPLTPVTPRSALFSSDDEYRTASEGGRRDSADWGDAVVQLSPSPVLNRTPISKVKEKVRARGCNHQPPTASPLSDAVTPSDCDEVDATKDKSDDIVSPFPCIKEIAKSESGAKTYKRSYISTIDKQSIEIEDLRKQLKMALNDVSSAETELSRLRKVKSDSILREKKMEELLSTLQKTEEELLMRTKEAESIDAIKQLYSQDKNMWECKLTETQNFLRESTEHCELLTRQLTSGQETIEHLQQELNNLNEKLHRSIKENDGLYAKIRDLELRGATLSPSKEKRKSIGSLSELTNINLDMNFDTMDKDHLKEEYVELRSRFLKAIQEIKVMKKELRESHGLYDELEVANIALRSEMKLREENNKSEMTMMADRIQDLTQKLTASDKQVRALKHKLQKSESREKRRSLSLKGRESFSIGKEVEEKLSELESKILILESAGGDKAPVINSPSKASSPAKEKSPKRDDCPADEKKLKRLAARLRRKSLDSATSSEPMKMLVRLSSLETKVSSALEGRKELATSCESLSQATRSTNSPTCIDSPEGSTAGTHSQKHLLDRLQSLENVVILSRNKVNECICQMSSLRASKSRRSPSPGIDKKHSIKSIEKCLADVSKTLQECFDKCVVEYEHGIEPDVPDTVAAVVQQLEEQLRDKLLEISRKKSVLLESGELDQRKNLELLAEKLAYEAVLVGRIQEALESSNGSRFFARLIKSEIDETSQLIETLRAKVDGTHSTNVPKNKSSMDYLARILSRKIDIMNSNGETKTLRKSELIIQSSDVELLKASQKEIAVAVDKFKSEKLAELSTALASETLSCTSSNDADCEQQRANAEAARVREAWAAARDALGAELVQAEVARALTRAAHACEGRLLDTRNGRLTLTAQDRADLELWWQAAHDHLRCEMDVAVRDIATRYRESLASASRRPSPEPGVPRDSRALLQQLADVLAHKALVDARIAVVDGTYRASLPDDGTQSDFSTMIQDVNRRSSEAENVVSSLESDPTQEAEFVYLFQHFSNECRALFSSDCSSNSEDLMKISQSLEQVETKVKQVQRQLSGQDEDSPKEEESSDQSMPSDCIQLQSVFDRCESLKRRVEALSTLVPCKHCKLLQDALDRLKSERSRGETALQQQAGALAAARRARQQLQAQHERERQQLRERARRLERRLATLDSEYSQQLENLRAAYHNTLATDLQGDGLRARYQAEIEQLRALCEKGLLAMESSHRRIVHEMEEKHRAEREQLRLDKEAALAEETRATLAALDAMRKAHESEVRREVDKFKADYLGRGSVAPPVGQLNSRHQQEMEEIKQEILSLSEKYSVKCVESAALEESLANATQQLAQAQQHIMQLDARNKQLRAHLMSEANEIKNAEASTLPLLIEDTSPHGQSAQGSPLWAHLRHLAAVWQKASQQESNTTESTELRTRDVSSEKDKNTICKNRKHKELATVPSAELKNTRCSVPGRASFSPLVGMVAERKKRFEI